MTAQTLQAYGVDMDLKHGAIVLATATWEDRTLVLEKVDLIAQWVNKAFNKDSPTHLLVKFGKEQARYVYETSPNLAIEWDRNRVYYRGARKSAVVQVATMIGSFLGNLRIPYIDITPAMKRRILNEKALTWTEFQEKSGIPLRLNDTNIPIRSNGTGFPPIDKEGDITDATAVAIYEMFRIQLGVEP